MEDHRRPQRTEGGPGFGQGQSRDHGSGTVSTKDPTTESTEKALPRRRRMHYTVVHEDGSLQLAAFATAEGGTGERGATRGDVAGQTVRRHHRQLAGRAAEIA